jgi:uncharacterized protein (DUF1499 family)
MSYINVLRVMVALVVIAGVAACTTLTNQIGVMAETTSNDLSCALPTNCVVTVGHNAVAPLHLNDTIAEGPAQLRTTIASFAEAKIARTRGALVDVASTTPAGFEDTVRFRAGATEKKIDLRSRSVVGLVDFGKKRSRMAEIAARFTQDGSSSHP